MTVLARGTLALVVIATGCATPDAHPVDGDAPFADSDAARWFSGDTHIHFWDSHLATPGPELTFEDIYARQKQRDLDLAGVLTWNGAGSNTETMLRESVSLIDGQEHPITRGDPDRVMKVDIEMSPFCRFQSHMPGHTVGLNLSDGMFCPFESYQAPNFDFFRAQPEAVTGYAHVTWPRDRDEFPALTCAQPVACGAVDAASPLTAGVAYMAPIDVAMGRVDFVESGRILVTPGIDVSWYSLWYRLLNCGFRIGIAGGSDNGCPSAAIGDVRTYALVRPPLTYPKWVKALKAGRTTIADTVEGNLRLIEIEVGDAVVGDQFDLQAGGGDVEVTVKYTVDAALGDQGQLELVRDGHVFHTEPYDLPEGGTHEFQVRVSFAESGWLAARQASAHTGAVFVLVDGKRIVKQADAVYMRRWCRMLVEDILGDSPCFDLERVPGFDTTPHVIAYIDEARLIFDALATRPDEPLPVPSVGTASLCDQGAFAMPPLLQSQP